MKKLLSVLLVAVLLITAMPLGAFEFKASAATEYTSGYYTYTVSNNEATITETNSNISGDVTIPERLDGYIVIGIGEYAFYDCDNLIGITIPDSVLSIGEYAFYICDSLKSVTIGNSVTSIGSEAFASCTSLTSITIPDSVTSIGDYVFECCYDLTSITIGDGITSIGYDPFFYCHSLTDVFITDLANWCNIDFEDVTSNPLSYAENLYLNGELVDSLTIPDSVTSIGNLAFTDCESLTDITIPNSVTSIGDDAFYLCSSLTDVFITDLAAWCNIDFKNITSNPLYYAENFYINGELITELTISDNISSIGDRAFAGYSGLTSITIPNNVTSIGNSTFAYCSNLTNITIPNSITSIGTSTFSHCSSLTSITIPNSVISIGNYAFSYCSNLTNITIPNIVTSIGTSAFSNCTSLTSINIPNCVTSIGNYAFTDCYDLTSITIGNGIKSISAGVFSNCTSLTNITIPDNIKSIEEKAFLGCSKLTNIIISDSVTSIGEYAFSECTSLTNITIPNSVINIEEAAFKGCSSLESITLPFVGSSRNASSTFDAVFGYIFGYALSSVSGTTEQKFIEHVYTRSYYYYIPSSLKSVTITDATRISYSAFYNCSNLTNITIPNSVRSIGRYAFYNCSSLKNITLPFVGSSRTSNGTSDAVFGYIFGTASNTESGTTLQRYGPDEGPYKNFSYYKIPSSLETVTITGTTQIPNYAFYNCSKLKNITIFDTATQFGDYTFYNCDNLENITISDTVTQIGNYAFYGCDKLEDVYYLGSKKDKLNISIGSNNSNFTSATWYYNVCLYHAHTYDNACDNTCNLCGVPREVPKHVYDNACDAYCNVCNASRTVSAHVYSNACDVDCNVCGYERSPEPHKVEMYTFTNATNYPFSLSGGIYTSTNNSHNSSATATLTVAVSGTITIKYYTSTESGYDKLIIKLNGTQKVSASGTTSWTTINIPVVAGDKIYITYSKDSSQAAGSDLVKFELSGYVIAEDLDPTCEDAVVCSICGVTVKEALGHNYTAECDTSCNVCGATRTASSHIYSNICDATCNICGSTRTPPHNYQWIVDKNNNCGVNGRKHKECTVCGAKSNENTVISATGNHTYDNACDKECNVCKQIRTVPEHIYNNACDTTCNICGVTRTITHNYQWIIDRENNCGVNGSKHEECTVCHVKRNENTIIPATGNHTYSNDCDSTCNICGTTRTVPEHIYDNACDTTCNICDITRTVPDHVYDNACDTTCNICGATRTVPAHVYDDNCDSTCNICNKTRTPPHYYEWVVDKENNCGVDGTKHEECTVCGVENNKNTIIPATGNHTYDNSEDVFCNICNEIRTVSCEQCTGTGQETNYTECSDCAGKGSTSLSCTKCGGDGISGYKDTEIWCARCLGTGMGTKEKTCSSCSGIKGYQVCGTCGLQLGTYDKLWYSYCPLCPATVIVYDACKTCKGKGTVTVREGSCTYCGGDGSYPSKQKIDCTYCEGGKNYIDCEQCVDGKISSKSQCTKCTGCGERFVAPNAPILKSADLQTVILEEIPNGEYSKDGINWQKSPVFKNLQLGQEYNFYQRFAKTTTTFSSIASEPLNVLPHEHVYDNACDTTCNICDKSRTITHSYSGACDDECNVCNFIRNSEANHTYDNTCDTDCNICGDVRNVTHTRKIFTTPATTSKDGYAVKKCTLCGDISSQRTIKKIKSFTLSTSTYLYNGKVRTPGVTVKDSAGNTISSKYYTVTYAKGRKNVGEYKVTVKFKGDYSGSKNLYFTIVPPKTTVSSVASGKKSFTVKVSKKSTQVTGYQIQYATNKNFTGASRKTVSSYSSVKHTFKNLKAKTTYYVRVRTFKKVGNKVYYSPYSTYKIVKTK